mmetsp:Transcript_23423/g.27141  ORF Transcript_23423/g.27141 Transcript_23423/m.27141 type:complete len:304 (-) Transcript_23423:362-1273(-)|eukprot:CAMPEP_0176420668 /NCGR_PEP_ID=MMETSP0127-20121128/8734_1 /TAXON_ID=938130 /ORGANISM="Platyophrya macrostoma, Strain WH" /LENGTH=303 /DNA_ID=CAMNT_0017801289 /DNA_START=42 /DNA_END=953 /DNA_ORIENTATION=+
MKRIHRMAAAALTARGAYVVDSRSLAGHTRFLRQFQSPALEAAERLTNPRVGFPASGPAESAADGDPRIQWREYWSSEHQMPYYHDLRSDAVTWEVPEGFVTRFPTYHAHNPALLVTVEGRVLRAGSATESAAQPQSSADTSGKPLTLKKKLALYGSGGLILYLIIHNICLFFVFSSIYFMGFDLVGLARSYGFNIKRATSPASSTDGSTATTDTATRPSFFGTFITAVLLNKLTVPVQLMFTLLLAPRFVPLLQPFANRVIPKIKSYFPISPFGATPAAAPAAAASAAANSDVAASTTASQR